ncbi:MAG TPA: hypothetical protein VG649_06785 [Candidatus Angelobacter sp.]|nr:hypothetical protein [Candidatus Angelobacter sp.]
MSSPSNNRADTASVLKRLGLFDLLARSLTPHKKREGLDTRRAEAQQKPEIVRTQEQSHPVAGQRPQVSDRVRLQDESKLQGKPQPLTRTQRERVGRKDFRSGRQILQPTQSAIENERLAAENAPKLETKLSSVAARVPGARFERLRPQKNLERVDEKIKEGKPAATISDYSAAQISAATPEAKDQLVREIKKKFPVISVEDKFLKGRKDKAGYPSANVQVKLSNGGTSEIQIVPSEVQAITDQTHHLYKEGRNARDAGDSKAAKTAFAAANKMNRQAVQQFLERNNTSDPTDSQSKPDHRQINPQANKISKGQEVVLLGRGKATVLYVSPVMNIVRVRLANGKQSTVRLSQIKEQ